jgi:YegS/Rv2252/BmrU family lipid kinase
VHSSPVFVIVNPLSGPGGSDVERRGRQRVELARRVLEAAGVPTRVELTRHAGHARSLAAEAVSAGARVAIAWGGDGTVNEVAGALAFGPVPLGIVPEGSGNGLATALGIKRDPERALRTALDGRVLTLDAGEIAGRLFFNVAGVGFDAHVARLFNARGRKRGFVAYIRTTLTELFRYAPQTYRIAIDDETIERRALMVVVANGTQYGNGARVAPDARLDDGELDLVVADARSPWRDLLRVRFLFDGSVARRPGILCRRVRAASIGAAGALEYHVDGECHESQGPLDIRVRPAALHVMAP